MNGEPSLSSFSPGPSPINIMSDVGSPSPGTVRVLVLWSGHVSHCAICFAISAMECVGLVVFNSLKMLDLYIYSIKVICIVNVTRIFSNK